MSKMPPRICVVAINPEIPSSLIKILQDYFECVPHIPYINRFKEVFYVLPDTKTIDHVFTNMYRHMQYRYTIELFRGGKYNYIDTYTSAFYQIEHEAGMLPACLDIKRLDRQKLEVF